MPYIQEEKNKPQQSLFYAQKGGVWKLFDSLNPCAVQFGKIHWKILSRGEIYEMKTSKFGYLLL